MGWVGKTHVVASSVGLIKGDTRSLDYGSYGYIGICMISRRHFPNNGT